MLSAYALSGTRLALRAAVGITGADPQSRTTWIDVAPKGTWEGHPAGAFTINDAAFKSILDDYDRNENPIPVDYEHASLAPSGQPTPAAGFVQKLEVRDGRLMALVEFTERAAGMIRAGEYRYCSGVFDFGAIDRKTGGESVCILDSIALTNRPFIDGQTPIALSRANTSRGARALGGTMITREAVLSGIEALDGKEFSAEQLEALIESLEKMAEAQDPKAAEQPDEMASEMAPSATAPLSAPVAAAPPPSPPEAGADTSSAAAMLVSKLMEATGMDEAALLAALDAKFEDIAAMIAGDGAAAMPTMAPLSRDVVRALSVQLAESKRALEEYRERDRKVEAARLDAQADAEVETLIAAGKILPAQKPTWRALARTSRDQFLALAKDLPRVVPMGKEASAIVAPASGGSATLHTDVVDEQDPRLAETVLALNKFGVKDAAIRTKALRKALDALNQAR